MTNELRQEIKDIVTKAFYKGATAGLEFPKIAKPNDTYLDGIIFQIDAAYKEYYGQISSHVYHAGKDGLKQDCMTGQEFYERFVKESGATVEQVEDQLKNDSPFNSFSMDVVDVYKFAKRAAGISE